MGGHLDGRPLRHQVPVVLLQLLLRVSSLAQIHEKVGNPSFGKPVACILACIGFGSCLNLWYGTKGKGDAKDEPLWAFLKCWCCGSCYVHQQYKEHGCTEECGKIITTSFKPSQAEMS